VQPNGSYPPIADIGCLVIYAHTVGVGDQMFSFRSVGRTISDRRNWPVILAGGALTFLGSLVFEALGFDSGLWVLALIVVVGIAARPFVKT
jgi:hypothetical protein